MEKIKRQSDYFGKEKISKILLKLAPPVMLAQLIQALYNVVDSLFIGRFSQSGLTALSIVYPLQLLMIALAVGTGVGINTVMAAKLGLKEENKANEYAGTATPIAIAMWAIFACVCYFLMPFYARSQTSSPEVIKDVVSYGRIVCVFSFGLFLESVWTKVIQARGDMKTPTIAQVFGAITNIILDPILIFGLLGFPRLGIAGAAIATVMGQMVAAAIVLKKGFYKSPKIKKYPYLAAKIFKLGAPSILMQAAYTVYIFGLNVILSTFSDAAVTVLGLYYKWQTFFIIPLNAMQTCIVPVISFNNASGKIERCKKTLDFSLLFGCALIIIGILCFELFPSTLLKLFSSDSSVIDIGTTAFRIIGISFIPLVISLTYPVLFQAVGKSGISSLLTVLRTIILFVPLGYVFSRAGLNYFWLTFPVTDGITSLTGFVFSKRFFIKESKKETENKELATVIKSKKGVVVAVSRTHGSLGKQIAKIVAQKLNVPFYYKEMIEVAAKDSGLSEKFISDINKNSPKAFKENYLSSFSVRHAVAVQKRTIEKIAKTGSCVIVGRAADYILRNRKNVLRVFITAPEEYRINNVVKVYGDTPEQARKNVKKSDSARAAYYKNISGLEWGKKDNYDIVIDSSIGKEKAAEILFNAAIEKEKNNKKTPK